MNQPALVLAPGLMCDASVWQHQLAALETAFDIHVIDYGERDSLPAMAECVLAQAPASFALAGHSMGGRVALEVMRLQPQRVTHLALLDTGCHALPAGEGADQERKIRFGFLHLAEQKGVAAMARAWVRNMVHPDRLEDAALIAQIVDMFARKSVAVYAAQVNALLNRPEAFPLLSSIHCPTLILTGDKDGNSPPAANQEMAAAALGAHLQVLTSCGHMSLLEQPQAVNAALQIWLARGSHP